MLSSRTSHVHLEVTAMTDPKKVQVICQYCWNSELRHAQAEEKTKEYADAQDASQFRVYRIPNNDSLYESAIMCDRRDLEGQGSTSFAKAKSEDLLFSFPRKEQETSESREIICYQRRVKDHSKVMKLETLHALRAVAILSDMRPKQTVIDFSRMLAESMLPVNCSELVVQAVAKEIFQAALASKQHGNQSA